MKYTICGFSQKVLMAYGLGVDEAVILRTIVDFWFTGRMETIRDGEREYFWLSYSFLQKELPILGIGAAQLANKMKAMIECGLLEAKIVARGKGSRTYFSIDQDMYLPLIDFESEHKPVEKAPNQSKPEIDGGKVEKAEFKKYFSDLYRLKAKEILGTTQTAEGKEIVPPWGAKEASLLLQDHNQYGLDGLKRMARIFFSDTDQGIAAFTRFKTKAGYSYTIFHSVLSKISPVDDVKPPCEICGQWKGHKASCTVERQNMESHKNSLEAIREELETTPVEFDFSEMLETIRKKPH